MCDSSGATAWTHDNMGRPLQDNRKIIGTATQNKVFTYTYNLDGSLATLKYPSTRIITYQTSAAGRTLSVKNTASGANYVTAVTYAPQGAVSSFTYDAGIKAAMSYNSRLQPLQMFYGTNSPPVITASSCPATIGNIMHRVYHFGTNNNNGNVQSIDNCRDTTRTANYQYDSTNRITQGNSSGPEWGDTYVVDSWGNLTNINPIAGKTNAHDAAGNLLSVGTLSYTYDDENRLSSANGWTYVYDGNGERVKKCNSCGSSSGGTLYFPSSVTDTPAEFDLAGTLKYEYIFFNGQRVARRDGTANPPFYYFADHLKSTTVVTNSTGAVQNDSDYFAYGGEIVLSNLQPQNYKFNGKERDSESGLDEFGARYFASSYGRFMQTDWSAKPTAVPYANYGNPQSLNLFSYVENNPTTVGDPDGHQDVTMVLENPAVQQVITAAESWGTQVVAAAGVLVTTMAAASGNMGNAYPMYYHGELQNPDGSSIFLSRGNSTQGGGKNAPTSQLSQSTPAQPSGNNGTSGGDRAGKPFTPKGKKEVKAADAEQNGGQTTCKKCGQPTVPAQQSQSGVTPPGNETHVDHIIPQSQNGDGSPSNGQVLCRTCNLQKSDTLPPPQ